MPDRPALTQAELDALEDVFREWYSIHGNAMEDDCMGDVYDLSLSLYAALPKACKSALAKASAFSN